MAVAIGVLVYERTASTSASHARALATQRAQIAASLFDSTGRLAFEATVNDPTAPAALRRAAAAGSVASYLQEGGGPAMMWAGAPLAHDDGAIFVQSSFLRSEQALSTLRNSLIEIGALATGVMALLGLLFASQLSRRLRAAAAVASRIGAGDPRARIGMRGRDEVAALAGAVDRMADSLHERIERERQFAGDVAHELRTPVSGLLAAATLLEDSEPARMVRDRASRLARLVEDLLEISRLEAGVESSLECEVDLGALVRGVCADRPVEVTGPGGEVHSDPRRLARIVSNLVENACRHGAPPLRVEVSPDRIRVRDQGEGFSAEMLSHGTERFTSGSSSRSRGTGLGLAIAAAQAGVIGARLTLENDAGGGAVVTVSLPCLHETATSDL